MNCRAVGVHPGVRLLYQGALWQREGCISSQLFLKPLSVQCGSQIDRPYNISFNTRYSRSLYQGTLFTRGLLLFQVNRFFNFNYKNIIEHK